MKLGKISVTIEISMSEFGMLESGSYLLGCLRSEIKAKSVELHQILISLAK